MRGAGVIAFEASPARWSVLVADAASGDVLLAHNPDEALRSASAAKLLVLAAAARAIDAGEVDAGEFLVRDESVRVADSGIWQHLHADALAVDDVARLIGLASDNWATNVLLRRLGGVERVSTDLAVVLHDEVRDVRGAEHPPSLSTGSARGYVELLTRLHGGGAVGDRVLGWLRGGFDLSMVAAAFGFDPLAHDAADRGLAVVNKTGTDVGVRVDAGVVTGPVRALVYACLANWTPSPGDPERDGVLALMRTLGAELRRRV